MKAASLRNRIRNGTLAMLAIAIVLGTLALPKVHRLGSAIRMTLYRNYLSIEASQQMHAALWRLQIAERDRTLAAALAPNRAEFTHWIGVEENDITEVGEAVLAQDIDQRGRRLFAELAGTAAGVGGGAGPGALHDDEFDALHARVDRLIRINRDAMFRADSRASRLGDQLTYEFAAGLVLLALLGVVLSWTLAWTISKPLDELAERLRSFSLRGPSVRLGEQPLAELQAVAVEFNKMAERLEQFDRLNVDRLVYEKSKTEAIIESLEDGIVLLDPKGIVTHINEIAAIILGVEREEALGSPFADLNSNHPHYIRVRAVLRSFAGAASNGYQVEVDLHVRGRNHTYVLKPVPLRQGEAQSFGVILILQDITYLRDKDRVRANLIATLSHELKTPVTSLALAAEILQRDNASFSSKQQALIDAIGEDALRMRNLADGLLDLARGEAQAITVSNVTLNLADLADSVVKAFAIQADQKGVTLKAAVQTADPRLRGDPVKLSWVMSNLVANALRYTPKGGSIEVSIEPADNYVRLTVSDTGPGIPAEIRDHLFERFAQWNANGFEGGSAGLGLSIAKEIVEAHGGRIFAESSTAGSTFTVELPVTERL